MQKYNATNPLEVQIIKNLSSLKIRMVSLWCDSLIIMPPEKNLDITQGRIEGFKTNSLIKTFTISYHPNEEVRFKPAADNLTGSLRVGNKNYLVDSKSSSEPIIHETKQFPKGHDELRNYLKSFGIK
jgi:hypothetical protein